MQESTNEGDRRKRQKLSSSTTTSTPDPQLQSKNINNQNSHNETTMSFSKPKPTGTVVVNASREEELGILQYVNTTNPGFTGILKQRYTDFVVNEIMEDGTVVHLTNTSPPKPVNSQQEVKNGSSASATASEITQTDGTSESKQILSDSHAKSEGLPTTTKDTEMVDAGDAKVEPNGDASSEVKTREKELQAKNVEDTQHVKTEVNSSESEVAKDQEQAQVTKESAQGKTDSKPDEAKGHVHVETVKEVVQDGKTETNDTTSKDSKGDETGKSEVDKPKAEEIIEDQTESTLKKCPVSDDDLKLLTSYFGNEVRDLMLALYNKVLERPGGKAASYGSVVSEVIKDRQLRTQIHQNVRRIFESKFETSANPDETIKVSVVGKLQRGGRQEDSWHSGTRGRSQLKGKLGWSELGGEHLHFTLYKENKDTMEVISYMASQLRVAPKIFSFAGTKDRRGVTAQRISIFRGDAKKLLNLNRDLRGSKVGDLKYEKHALSLGELRGNEFLITLRDCQFASESLDETTKFETAKQIVGEAIKKMSENGFINYYGLQRFGSFSTGTHEVGKLILKSDFRGAVQAILSFNPDLLDVDDQTDNLTYGRDDIARAIAINLFETRSSNDAALRRIPKKFSAEIAIMRWLNGSRQNDYIGALISINRGLKLMFVHAYQSLVWNYAASERWARFGGEVVEGDLVLVKSKESKETDGAVDADMADIDESGEVIVKPASDDAAVSLEDQFERARPLTKEEASSGEYSIFDVVLPTPGYDVEYPKNEVANFYKTFMASENGGGLDPMNMRRPQKDFSLSGSYRKLIGRVENTSFEVKMYTDDKEQLIETDLDRFYKGKTRPQPPPPRFPQQNRYQSQQRGPPGQSQIPQDNPWASFKGNLAEADKAFADELKAQNAAAALEGPKPPSMVEDRFIETNAETGERTGVRETVIKELKPLDARNGQVYTAEQAKLSAPEDIPLPATPMLKAKIAPSTVLKRSAAQMDSEDSNASNVDEAEKKDASENLDGEKADTEVLLKNPEVASDDTMATDSAPAAPQKLAVIVSFKLGSSQYATMALRELMKSGGVKEYRSGYIGR